ncbi:hypothetical protein [Nonomuraea sp. NEAU-A123]|uniref:hypothetical protein n=1 Tax=Nonomuraea sp. NEAU-A123 TaxID=2839649 RepID=UPI001BE4A1F4|nr:hypothetical protein [Nonomuraea sp. NEAU-A123]MBT2225769.1 hypothetical protein [Nonomuraea sp. NEAU-A123]
MLREADRPSSGAQTIGRASVLDQPLPDLAAIELLTGPVIAIADITITPYDPHRVCPDPYDWRLGALIETRDDALSDERRQHSCWVCTADAPSLSLDSRPCAYVMRDPDATDQD